MIITKCKGGKSIKEGVKPVSEETVILRDLFTLGDQDDFDALATQIKSMEKVGFINIVAVTSFGYKNEYQDVINDGHDIGWIITQGSMDVRTFIRFLIEQTGQHPKVDREVPSSDMRCGLYDGSSEDILAKEGLIEGKIWCGSKKAREKRLCQKEILESQEIVH